MIAEISRLIERYAIRLEKEDGLRLRKANRIRTIHSSLAIEGNVTMNLNSYTHLRMAMDEWEDCGNH